MNKGKMILLISAGLLLAACGKDEGGETQKATTKAATPAAASTPASAPQAMPQGGDDATRYIDHTNDEVEFRLKRSLAGLESLLEDASDAEQVAMIKQDITALESKLAKP